MLFFVSILAPGVCFGVTATLMVQFSLCKMASSPALPASSQGDRTSCSRKQGKTGHKFNGDGVANVIDMFDSPISPVFYLSQSGMCHKRPVCSGMKSPRKIPLCTKCFG